MSRQAAGMTAAGGLMRVAATIALAAALALQVIAAPPLAMRMAASAAGWQVASICGGGGADRTDAPASPHQHVTCLLCLGHSPAGGMAVAVAIVSPAASRVPDAPVAGLAAPAPARAFRLYASRGPPVLGA